MDWISVKDQLPDEYEFVLVFADNQGTGEPKPISIARMPPHGFWEFMGDTERSGPWGAYMDIEFHIDGEDITHWMPLPKPPKESNE